MATALTPVTSQRLPHLQNYLRVVYAVPSVLPTSTSPRYSLPIQVVAGELTQMRLAYTGATTTTVYILTSDLSTRNSLEHIVQTPVVTNCFSQGNLGIHFQNTDPAAAVIAKGSTGTALLYVEVDNTGASATGEIGLELIIKTPGVGG